MKHLILIAALLASGCGYSHLQELDDRARAARTDLEVLLQRRADLVPNLLETVSTYRALEPGIENALAQARERLAGALGSGELGRVESAAEELSIAFQRLLAVTRHEAWALRDPSFMMIESRFEQTAVDIENAWRVYNEAAQEYNVYIRDFPQVFIAKVVGAEPREYHSTPARAELGNRD